jgi:signal transduction histidine kinase
VTLESQPDQLELREYLVHDLTSPVNAIDLLAQSLLRARGDTQRSFAAANAIRGQVRVLQRMIADFLDLGVAEHGRFSLARAPIDAVVLVQAAFEELCDRATAADIMFASKVDAPTIFVDFNVMRRVLVNLLENALDHAPTRSTVEVEVVRNASVTTRAEPRARREGPAGCARMPVHRDLEAARS